MHGFKQAINYEKLFKFMIIRLKVTAAIVVKLLFCILKFHHFYDWIAGFISYIKVFRGAVVLYFFLFYLACFAVYLLLVKKILYSMYNIWSFQTEGLYFFVLMPA